MKQIYLIELDTNEKEEINGVLKIIDVNNKKLTPKEYEIKKIKIIHNRTPADTVECDGVTINLSKECNEYSIELIASD